MSPLQFTTGISKMLLFQVTKHTSFSTCMSTFGGPTTIIAPPIHDWHFKIVYASRVPPRPIGGSASLRLGVSRTSGKVRTALKKLTEYCCGGRGGRQAQRDGKSDVTASWDDFWVWGGHFGHLEGHFGHLGGHFGGPGGPLSGPRGVILGTWGVIFSTFIFVPILCSILVPLGCPKGGPGEPKIHQN